LPMGEVEPCRGSQPCPSHASAWHMTLRTDHITGALAILMGVMIIAISGELPVGSLSFPGAGLWPKLLALLMIVLGIVQREQLRPQPGAGDPARRRGSRALHHARLRHQHG